MLWRDSRPDAQTGIRVPTLAERRSVRCAPLFTRTPSPPSPGSRARTPLTSSTCTGRVSPARSPAGLTDSRPANWPSLAAADRRCFYQPLLRAGRLPQMFTHRSRRPRGLGRPQQPSEALIGSRGGKPPGAPRRRPCGVLPAVTTYPDQVCVVLGVAGDAADGVELLLEAGDVFIPPPPPADLATCGDKQTGQRSAVSSQRSVVSDHRSEVPGQWVTDEQTVGGRRTASSGGRSRVSGQ